MLGGLRAIGPMRSKPDQADQPKRTAHYDCAMCIAEMLHNTETVLLIFPFLQTNITVQMRPSGGYGWPGETCLRSDLLCVEWDVKLYSLTPSIYVYVKLTAELRKIPKETVQSTVCLTLNFSAFVCTSCLITEDTK